jgi:hypothetical protein
MAIFPSFNGAHGALVIFLEPADWQIRPLMVRFTIQPVLLILEVYYKNYNFSKHQMALKNAYLSHPDVANRSFCK